MDKEERDQLKTQEKELKKAVSEAKSALRKFKVANKIKDIETEEDPEIIDQFEALQEKVTESNEAWEAVVTQLKETKGSSVGTQKYGYQQVKDPVTGEMREMDEAERKKWRTKARREVKKSDDYTDPSQVPFDPNFLMPKPKKEKPKKEEKEKGKETGKEEAAEKVVDKSAKSVKKSKKAKPAPSEEDDD
jgi:hypothetical protein